MDQLTKPIEAHSDTKQLADLSIRPPEQDHGGGMWQVASDSGTLDLNSSYAYLLFARDFAETSRVALHEGEVVGFVIGYLRPEDEDRLFIWQIAVDESMRGQRVAARMLDSLVAELPGVQYVETTITEDNKASQRLFQSLAQRHDADHLTDPLFEVGAFPDLHDAEHLHVVGDLQPRG